MRDLVPGYTIRNVDGDLVGFKCPISLRSFYGDDGERQQYIHTHKIMLDQNADGADVGTRRQMYIRVHGR